MTVKSTFAPLSPHDLSLIKVKFPHIPTLVYLMPPPALLVQALYKLMIVAPTNLVLVKALLLRHGDTSRLSLAFILLSILWTIRFSLLPRLVYSKALPNDETLVLCSCDSILFVQYSVYKPHHLLFDLTKRPMVPKTIK